GFVPLMIVLYVVGGLLVPVLNVADLPAALALVFTDAFTGTAATGGFIGAGVAAAIQFGVARGMFSNESGLGSAAIAAAAAQTRHPVRQGLVSMTQTFIDTIIVVTMTGLVIVVSGSWTSGLEGAAVTAEAFDRGVGGGGHYIVTLSEEFVDDGRGLRPVVGRVGSLRRLRLGGLLRLLARAGLGLLRRALPRAGDRHPGGDSVPARVLLRGVHRAHHRAVRGVDVLGRDE